MTTPGRLWTAAFGGTLAAAMAAGAFPGFAFSVLGPLLVEDFAITRSQLGLLTTACFLVGGAASLAAGPAVDRVGARRVLGLTTGVVAACLLAMAVAPGFALMVAGAGIAGVGLAAGNPATNQLIRRHLPAGRRGVVMGVKQAGVPGVGFLAGAVLGPAAAAVGWRGALSASALLPVAVLVLTLIVFPRDPPAALRQESRRRVRVATPPAVRWLATYAFLMGVGVAAVNAYLPLYAVEEAGLSPARASTVVAAMSLFAMIARVSWGWLSERRNSYFGPLLGMALGGAVAIGGILLAPAALPLLWLAAVVLGMTAVTWNSVGMLAVLATVGREQTGSASGLVLFGFFTGWVPSPFAFGATVDALDSYAPAWAGVIVVYLVAALVMARLRFGSAIIRPERPTD